MRSPAGKKLFPAGSPALITPARIRPRARIGRQNNLAAIGKLKITQVDTATPALDDESGTDREAVWQTRDS
jgi:hypothetical protein